MSQTEAIICPTRVGMNRLVICSPALIWNLPHTRGDEPQREDPHRCGERSALHTCVNELHLSLASFIFAYNILIITTIMMN